MGVWGGVLFLVFNVFILLIIRWSIQNDGRTREGSTVGLFAMRKNRTGVNRRLEPRGYREKFANGWQGSYRDGAPAQQSTTDGA